MTSVLCKLSKENNFEYIIIEGHAGYATKGKDIVCSAISAITNGTINFLQKYYKNCCKISYSVAGIEITILLHNAESQLCLQLMVYQLENIANFYPNYLKINKEQWSEKNILVKN